MSIAIEIEGALSAAAVADIIAQIGGLDFVDGKHSAGQWAQRQKRNEEVPANSAIAQQQGRRIVASLSTQPLFRSAALPHRNSELIFARYRPGMGYGLHQDDPVFGAWGVGDNQLRVDLAVTVFLSEPRDYAGGELRIHALDGVRSVKLPAGNAVLYPASTLHEVTPVTSGERIVAVFWLQSLVRDAEKRALLLDLDLARTELRQGAPDALATARVDNAYANLIRRWADV
jgi:PKHD-type hydroxylase